VGGGDKAQLREGRNPSKVQTSAAENEKSVLGGGDQRVHTICSGTVRKRQSGFPNNGERDKKKTEGETDPVTILKKGAPGRWKTSRTRVVWPRPEQRSWMGEKKGGAEGDGGFHNKGKGGKKQRSWRQKLDLTRKKAEKKHHKEKGSNEGGKGDNSDQKPRVGWNKRVKGAGAGKAG